MLVPLKIVSDYSLLKSLISLPKFIPYMKNKGITSLGICDDNLYGVMEFYNLCRENQIKPIIGLKVPFFDISISLYAKNYQGYLNLLQIHTCKEKKEDLTKIDKKLWENILVMLDASYIEFYDELLKYISEDCLFISYQNISEKTNAYLKSANVVYAREIKTISVKSAHIINLLEAILKNIALDNVEIKSYEKNSLEDFWDASLEDISSTEYFASLCDVKIPKDKRYIPHYNEEIEDSFNYLMALSKKGLAKRLNNQVSEKYVNRLKYELSVIQKMGFVDYFLIVYDYVKYAKKNKILVGVGRGSAAGSLVSYALGITEVDPLKYNLFFERFLNPERITMPDIDIDFELTRRGEVINYVKDKYGHDKVANIMTFGTLKSKLAIRLVCKSLNIDDYLLEKFVGKIDANKSIEENLKNPYIKELINNNKALIKVINYSLQIEGLKKHISTHAAGVVISSVSLDKVIPICYNNGDILTGVTMNYLEELGLIKMDFLSIANLTTIDNVLKLIKENLHQELDLNKINLNDKKVMELFLNADTVGIFQFESEGIKNFLRKLRPNCLEDIINAIALYRPGPMDNIDSFIRRKHKEEKVKYLHPSLEPILKDTYGIIIYQEQIMQILQVVANYSLAEADLIRRAMSKKKKEVIESQQEDFVNRAVKNNYSKEIALEIFSLILKFANYGFNKSHSVSYAIIGVQMAYLKCYYPIYFITNLLNMSINSVSKTKEYLSLAKKYHIQFLMPSINYSQINYVVDNNRLRLPLTIIKNIGIESVKTIISKRTSPYKNFFDFVSRTYGGNVNRKTIEALITAGAFDEFSLNHPTLRYNMDTALNYATLVSEIDSSLVEEPIMEYKDDLTLEEKRNEELEAFGMFISNHPASKYGEDKVLKLYKIKDYFDKRVNCVVIIDSIKKIKTKKNEDMAFITASDDTSSGNFVIFNREIVDLDNLKVGDLVLINGRVTKRYADYQININKIRKI